MLLLNVLRQTEEFIGSDSCSIKSDDHDFVCDSELHLGAMSLLLKMW